MKNDNIYIGIIALLLGLIIGIGVMYLGNRSSTEEKFNIENNLEDIEGVQEQDDVISDLIEETDSTNTDIANNNTQRETMTIKVPVSGDYWDGYTLIDYTVPKSAKVLNAVYKKLFELQIAIGSDYYGYNGLTFNSVDIEDGIATLRLVGNWMPVGDMSGAYMQTLIEAAAFQYPTVNKLIVMVNGAVFDWCVEDMSDGEGGCPETPRYWMVDKVDSFIKEVSAGQSLLQ